MFVVYLPWSNLIVAQKNTSKLIKQFNLKLKIMKIAVVGCAHGEIERIYETLESIENENESKVDLLLCCGDFQTARNQNDLESMARSKDYHDMQTFFKYYNGDKTAPVLTIFVGGNHEASNYLQELPFGGWVAPNIYYLGYAGCVNVNGLRIGGISGKRCKMFHNAVVLNKILISGIYKRYSYHRGHYEFPPYTKKTLRSVYHVREFEVFKLLQLSSKIDIFLSHDWPQNIDKYGDNVTADGLSEMKPHFQEDILNNCLGSPANKKILDHLKPSYWFAGHLHCRFSAVVPHSKASNTKFLALDKAVNDSYERKFLEILDIDVEREESALSYDLEWLTILYLTQHLNTGKKKEGFMPRESERQRWNFTPTDEEKEIVLSKFDNNLEIPMNFCRTTKSEDNASKNDSVKFNPQTGKFCSTLDIEDPVRVAMKAVNKASK